MNNTVDRLVEMVYEVAEMYGLTEEQKDIINESIHMVAMQIC